MAATARAGMISWRIGTSWRDLDRCPKGRLTRTRLNPDASPCVAAHRNDVRWRTRPLGERTFRWTGFRALPRPTSRSRAAIQLPSPFAIRYSLLATLLRSHHEPHRRGPDGPDREDQD